MCSSFFSFFPLFIHIFFVSFAICFTYMTATNRRRSSLVEQNISSHLSAIFFSRFQSYVSSKEIPSYSNRKNEKKCTKLYEIQYEIQFRTVSYEMYETRKSSEKPQWDGRAWSQNHRKQINKESMKKKLKIS